MAYSHGHAATCQLGTELVDQGDRPVPAAGASDRDVHRGAGYLEDVGDEFRDARDRIPPGAGAGGRDPIVARAQARRASKWPSRRNAPRNGLSRGTTADAGAVYGRDPIRRIDQHSVSGVSSESAIKKQPSCENDEAPERLHPR